MNNQIQWKNKNYHTVGTVPSSNGKIVKKRGTLDTLTHKYMTASAHFPDFIQALQLKVAVLN